MPYARFTIAPLLLLLGCSFSQAGNEPLFATTENSNNTEQIAQQSSIEERKLDPKTLILSFAPFEDYINTNKIFNPFTAHLESCLQRQVIFYPMQSNEAEIAAMQSNRLHIAGFSTGSTVKAVEDAHAIPFATQGNSEGFVGAELIVIVRQDSPFQKLADLKKKRVAHSNSTSLTGHLAPLTFFPKEGLIPQEDYSIMFSGKHDQSILGVLSGDYDAATTTTEIFERMVQHQEIDLEDFRIIYQSQTFPSAAFVYSANLKAELQAQIEYCFFNYAFPEEMKIGFGGADFFVPVDYEKDWAHIREILETAQPSNSQKKP